MGENFRKALLEADKKVDKKADKKTDSSSKKKEGKMLGKLHDLDDKIEDFIDSLEDQIMSVEDNPVFVKKAQQLLADMSKEYSEFIMALRAIVNAVDRKGQMLPSIPPQPSRVRDVMDGSGEEEPPVEEELPPEEEAPPEEEGDDDEFELKVAKKKGGKKKPAKKKSPVKEALEMDEAINPKTDLILLGKEVNYAMGMVGLRPKKEDFKKAAKKLDITIKQAERAWNKYTWG